MTQQTPKPTGKRLAALLDIYHRRNATEANEAPAPAMVKGGGSFELREECLRLEGAIGQALQELGLLKIHLSLNPKARAPVKTLKNAAATAPAWSQEQNEKTAPAPANGQGHGLFARLKTSLAQLLGD